MYTCIFFLGGLCVCTAPDALGPDHFSIQKPTFLKIYIADEPRESTGLVRFKARVISVLKGNNRTKSSGLLMVTINTADTIRAAKTNTRPTAFSYGAVYLIPARYTVVPPPLNPEEFDSKTWMANQQIYHQVFLSARELIPIHEQQGSPIISFALALRKRQVNLYRRLIRSDEAFAVAATLILGYRADLDAETLAAYSQTGTIHALSVSGMHVALVYCILEYALRWMNRKVVLKWIKIIVILTLIWFYTLLTGYSASVLRSAIMLSLIILSKTAHKNTGGYHVLAFSAFCLLFENPLLLWDVGFQLSYLAVLGLIYLHPKLYPLFSFKWRPVQNAWSITSVSLAAQLFTLPLSVYYFHQFPVYFLISNLFIAPLVTVLMYTGITLLLFRFYWLAAPFEWLINFMNHGLSWIANLPYSGIHSIWITKLELCLLCMLLYFLITGISDRSKHRVFSGLLLLIFLQGMLLKDKIAARQQVMIIFYSLNRNYAAAFIRSDKAVLITDLLPTDKAFKFHIQPSLDQRKITTILCIPWNTVHPPQPQWTHQQRHLKGLLIRDHQIHFQNFSILMADTFFNRRKITGKPAFDAIWVHGNPSLKSTEIRKTVRCKKIWMDATNRNYLINKFERDKLYFKYSVYVFKKNKASLTCLQ